MDRFRPALELAAIGLLAAASAAAAQQATISTPFHAVGNSFFERTGVSWGLNWNNGFARFGGAGAAVPPFGNFDPAAGANLGAGFRSGGLNGFLNVNAAQGSRQSFVSQSPSMTLTNGVPGLLSDSSQTPFVVGFTPVVGGFPIFGAVAPRSPPAYALPGQASPGNPAVQAALQQVRQNGQAIAAPSQPIPAAANRPAPRALLERKQPVQPQGPDGSRAVGQSSTAARPVASIEEARRIREHESQRAHAEAEDYLHRARQAEAEGKTGVAKVYYQMASRRADGDLKVTILARLDALGP